MAQAHSLMKKRISFAASLLLCAFLTLLTALRVTWGAGGERPDALTSAGKSSAGAGSHLQSTSRTAAKKPVIPLHYRMQLKTDFQSFITEGSMSIDIVIAVKSDKITLNSVGISVYEVVLNYLDNKISPLAMHANYEKQTIEFVFEKDVLQPGSATLSFRFLSHMGYRSTGIYRASYDDAIITSADISEESRHFMLQLFQPRNARKTFPCWDDPSFKARFTLSVEIPLDLSVLSTGEAITVSQSVTQKNYKKVFFSQTPLISTYFLGFVVGKFGYLEDHAVETLKFGTVRRVRVRVYSAVSDQTLSKFALFKTCRLLEFFAEYFDTAYGASKLDVVAIPGHVDVTSESLGLIALPQDIVLTESKDKGKDGDSSRSENGFRSLLQKEREIEITEQLTHMIAHQWVGCMMTFANWKDAWVKEAVVVWLTARMYDGSMSPLHELPTSVLSQHELAFEEERYGALTTLEDVFSSVPYRMDDLAAFKGATVIHMLVDIVTEREFMIALKRVLRTAQERSITASELWQEIRISALDSSSVMSKFDIKSFVNCWATRQGYPLIRVSLAGTDLRLQQEKMPVAKENGVFVAESDSDAEEFEPWMCPVLIGRERRIFAETQGSYSITDAPQNVQRSCVGAIYVPGNVYFAVAMHPELLRDLMDCEDLTVEERVKYVADFLGLFELGAVPAHHVLRFASSMQRHPIVPMLLLELGNAIVDIAALWHDEEVVFRLASEIGRDLSRPVAQELGWPLGYGDPAINGVQHTALQLGGQFGDPNIVELARAIYARRRTGVIPAAQLDLVNTIVAANDNSDAVVSELIADVSKGVLSYDGEYAAMQGIAYGRNLTMIGEFFSCKLQSVMGPMWCGTTVSMPILLDFIRTLVLLPGGCRVVVKNMILNWNIVRQKFQANDMYSHVTEIFGCVSDRETLKKVVELLGGTRSTGARESEAIGAERTRLQTHVTRRVQTRIAMREAQKGELVLWVTARRRPAR